MKPKKLNRERKKAAFSNGKRECKFGRRYGENANEFWRRNISGKNKQKELLYRKKCIIIVFVHETACVGRMRQYYYYKEDEVLNKTELVAAIAAKAGISKKDADAALGAFTDSIVEEIKKGGKVQIVGFGTFEARQRAARTGINPQTKQQIKIAASTVPAFKAGKAFKDAVK